MRKIMIMAMALSLAVVNISCKKGADKLGNAVLNLGGEQEANTIIDFNNNFIDSYKNTSKHVERILKYADEAVVRSKGGNVMMMPVISSMDYSFSKIKEVPSGFEKDKAGIESDFNIYKTKKEKIEKKFEELKSYMNSEDYKDDKGAKAENLRKEIETEADALYLAGENIIMKIKPATDAAEEVILKDHPLKNYILSSKNVMNSLDSVVELLGKQYTEKFNEAEAQKKYNEFAKAVEANAKLVFDVKDPQYAYKKSQFEIFNKNASSFLDTYRKLIRDAKEAGKIPDNNIQQIDSSYESVLSSYNSFVK
ncbi:YiiG family protein [Chryseobacterium sp. WG14]|uniref:YiiG family protein n=1 Tax=Chryseobacterium sp. WG14 TaxID=2926909 RepID=UPI00211F2BE9|nr:YiiG family protein [Chryseobacterium sp. WG14]MCQ9639107.1 YiiG family protein [Chryseobacterium sp. WG14]